MQNLSTIRDFFRYAISRFNEAGLVYGHGTENAVDEAAFLVLEGLHLPIDRLDPFLDAHLTAVERERLAALIEARIATRKPASYLLGKAYIHGVPFRVDERVIVPRSFIGELLFGDIVVGGEGSMIEHPDEVATVLDLCTGSGCLAILAAGLFPNATVDAVDLSPDALAVAAENVADHGVGDRVSLLCGDLWQPLAGKSYDLILTNPPYVDADAMASLPPEFSAEPRLALDGGPDGLDIVRRILEAAPAHLKPGGGLLCEIGTGRDVLEAERPDLPFVWLDTQASSGEVFWLPAKAFKRR